MRPWRRSRGTRRSFRGPFGAPAASAAAPRTRSAGGLRVYRDISLIRNLFCPQVFVSLWRAEVFVGRASLLARVNRGTSLIRNWHTPYDYHRALGMVLLYGSGVGVEEFGLRGEG